MNTGATERTVDPRLPVIVGVGQVIQKDVDPRDAEAVNWAMSYRMQPYRDIEIRETELSLGLDFSIAPPDSRKDVASMKSSAILIDATCKWAYPPTSLPQKQFMEKAQSIWEEMIDELAACPKTRSSRSARASIARGRSCASSTRR